MFSSKSSLIRISIDGGMLIDTSQMKTKGGIYMDEKNAWRLSKVLRMLHAVYSIHGRHPVASDIHLSRGSRAT